MEGFMKKIISLLVVSVFVLTLMVGCSSGKPTASQKSEEELRAEIQAEMDAEAKMKEEMEAEIKVELEAEQEVKEENEVQEEPEEMNAPAQQESKTSEQPAKEQNDISKGYTYKVESGSLKITYTNTGNTETLIQANKIYDVIKDGEAFTMDWGFSVLSANKDGNKLHFNSIDPSGDWEVTYYIDTNTKKIYWVESKIYNPNDSGIYPKITGFKNEEINGFQVDYSKYCAVLVPRYNGINLSALDKVTEIVGSVTQGNLSMKLNFAVFGHMKDIEITYFEGMDSEGQTIKVGTLYNSNVEVEIWLPSNDMSRIFVAGEVPSGQGKYYSQSFTMDDMRDSAEYEVIISE